jgi:hypothetical protein
VTTACFVARSHGGGQLPAFPAPSAIERDNEFAELGRNTRRENEDVCLSVSNTEAIV